MAELYFDSLEDLEAYQAGKNQPSPEQSGTIYFDSLEELEAYQAENAAAKPAPVEAESLQEIEKPARDNMGSAVVKSLQNVPERLEQSTGGLVRMLGEDMSVERERYIADRARQYGITPDDMKLIAAAGQSGYWEGKERPKTVQDALQQLKTESYQGTPTSVIEPETVSDFGAYMGERAQETMKPIDVEPGSAAYYVSGAIGSLAEMVPALAAAIATKKPSSALAIMSGQVGGQAYEQARQTGASPEIAQQYALGSVAAEVIPSTLPLGIALQRGPSFVAKALGVTVAEGGQEMITEAVNIGLDQGLLDEQMTWGEALTRLKDAGIIGTLAGAGTGAIAGTADKAQTAYEKATKDRQFAKAMDQNVTQMLSGEMQRVFGDPLVQPVTTEAMLRPSMRELVNQELTARGLQPLGAPVDAAPPALPASPQPEVNTDQPAIDEIVIDEPFAEASESAPTTVEQPIETPELEPVEVEVEAETEAPTELQIESLSILEAPIDEITISDDVPQFKAGADALGVVEPLGGTFDRTGVAPIQVWVREDGRKEVISGRHRLDLAKRSGESTIPAQYHYESEGFDADQAATLDALLNIREGQGSVRDYVGFIQGAQLTEAEANAQGILARQTGKRAYSIATKGSDALIASHAARDITDEAATRIAEAAPNNESLQAVGLKALQDGKSIAIAENMVKAVSTMAQPQAKDGDLFGFDDSAIVEAERMAKRAAEIQATIQKQITAVKGAAKNPKTAKQLGVNVKNPKEVQERIKKLEADKTAWKAWPTDAAKVQQLQKDVSPTAAQYDKPKPKPKPKTDEVPDTNKILFAPKDTFNLPADSYVPTYESASGGMPDRVETITLDGWPHKVPRVQRHEPIHHQLIKLIGRRTYYRHIKGKGVQGWYNRGTGVVRTRKKNDIEILAHEMAHYLDFYSNRNGLPDFQGSYRSKPYREEMISLSYPGIAENDIGLQMTEGFAEFVRLWLTNHTAALERAPKFYRQFNRLIHTQGPTQHGFAKKMNNLRRLMHFYYYQGYDGRLEAGIGHYPTLSHRFDEWWYRRISRVRQQVIDSAEAYKMVELELTKKIGSAEASAWKMQRIARGGYREIAAHFMNFGTLNWSENGGMEVTGKSLREVLAPIKKVKLSKADKKKSKNKVDFMLKYFKARRAVELHEQGRENQVNISDAQKMVAAGNAYPQIVKIFDDLQAFNQRMMDFYEASGLVGEESRAMIEEMNKNYVPFHRVREYIGGAKAPKGGFKQLKGGTANTEDILINIQDGIVENVRAAMQNKAKVMLFETIEASEDGALFAARIPPRSEMVRVDTDAMKQKVKEIMIKMGLIDPIAENNPVIDIDNPALLQFWKHGLPPSVGDSGNLIESYLVGGKTKYFEVRDPLLIESLQSMDPVQLGLILRTMHGVKNLFTRTVTLGLEFMGANAVMDTLSAFTYTKNRGYKPVIGTLVGMYDFLTHNENYQAFIRSGGGGSSLEAITRQGASRRSVRIDEFGPMTIPDRILAAIDKYGAASEYGTRIHEFKESRKSGYTDFESAFHGREISTDYNVIGASPFLANFFRSIHFFNAALQSMDRLYREFKTPEKGGNVTNFVVRSLMGVMIPTVMLYLYNRDDETYKDEPAHKRLKNWYIPYGKYENGRTKYFLIPRPYDAGHLFGSLPEILTEYMFYDADDDRAVYDFWWVMGNMFALDPTPSIFMGAKDIYTNKDWKGAFVIPPQYQGIADESKQFDSRTSETFYQFGKLTGLSPMKAQHMWSTSTGYLGAYLLKTMDYLLWDESRAGEKIQPQWQSWPWLTRFFTPKVRPYIRDTQEFFELKSLSDAIFKEFGQNLTSDRAISGRMDKPGFEDDQIKKWLSVAGLTKEEKETLYGLNKSLNKLSQALYGKNGLKTAELGILYNQKLSAEEKRKQIDQLWLTRNQTIKQSMTEFRSQIKQARKTASKRRKGGKGQ